MSLVYSLSNIFVHFLELLFQLEIQLLVAFRIRLLFLLSGFRCLFRLFLGFLLLRLEVAVEALLYFPRNRIVERVVLKPEQVRREALLVCHVLWVAVAGVVVLVRECELALVERLQLFEAPVRSDSGKVRDLEPLKLPSEGLVILVRDRERLLVNPLVCLCRFLNVLCHLSSPLS